MNKYILVLIALLTVIAFALFKKLFRKSRIPSICGKHVLVTGGSSGIGKSVAVEAARRGAHVTIIARNIEKLRLAVEEIKKEAKCPESSFELTYSPTFLVDVANESQLIEEKFNKIEEEVGPIFLLVNCAGRAIFGRLQDVKEEDYRYMMDLNFFGTIIPTLFLANKMKTRNEGHIVITGSQGSLIGIYGMGAYCSSKFALRGFTESLYMELSPYNVSVTLCLPPDTKTPGFEIEEKSKPEVTKEISKAAGLFEPEVVARQLLSDALNGNFFSVVGFESLILTTLCSGMSPVSSLIEGILSISLMSFLKFISLGYLYHFNRIISNHEKFPVRKMACVDKEE
ncbi:hypothetical protein RUM43_000038 [Polyplax serrata]|uniref:3-dehydrosphinganine reductase n=1 Tax=Polyplax serrata TaxID=468196 RepID=A0AAN8SFX7_POLSC